MPNNPVALHRGRASREGVGSQTRGDLVGAGTELGGERRHQTLQEERQGGRQEISRDV